jgi:hypothetical protein
MSLRKSSLSAADCLSANPHKAQESTALRIERGLTAGLADRQFVHKDRSKGPHTKIYQNEDCSRQLNENKWK